MSETDGSGPVDRTVGPKVTGSPDVIWLCYGDIEADCTHLEVERHDIVTWCEDKQDAADVRYVRGDIADALRDKVNVLEEEAKIMRAAMKMAMAILGPLKEAIEAELAKQPPPNDSWAQRRRRC